MRSPKNDFSKKFPVCTRAARIHLQAPSAGAGGDGARRGRELLGLYRLVEQPNPCFSLYSAIPWCVCAQPRVPVQISTSDPPAQLEIDQGGRPGHWAATAGPFPAARDQMSSCSILGHSILRPRAMSRGPGRSENRRARRIWPARNRPSSHGLRGTQWARLARRRAHAAHVKAVIVSESSKMTVQ